MTQALALLVAAIQLLTVVANTPNLPQSFKDEAISIAHIAITESNSVLQTQPNAPQIDISPITQTVSPQSFGNITPVITSSPDLSGIKISIEASGRNPDPQNGHPFGDWIFIASVLDSNGNYTKGAQITMTPPSDDALPTDAKDNTGFANNVTGSTGMNTPPILNDWNKDFIYAPIATGTKTILFTSGNLTKTETIEVP